MARIKKKTTCKKSLQLFYFRGETLPSYYHLKSFPLLPLPGVTIAAVTFGYSKKKERLRHV